MAADTALSRLRLLSLVCGKQNTFHKVIRLHMTLMEIFVLVDLCTQDPLMQKMWTAGAFLVSANRIAQVQYQH